MAIVRNGISKGFSGKIGDLIFIQQHNGTTIVKLKNKSVKKLRTVKQLSIWQDTSVTASFIKPLKGFADVGYELQAKLEKRSPYNSLASHIRQCAITGAYPERNIDFTRLLVTAGQMQPPENAAVCLTESGLSFSWNAKSQTQYANYSDQVMLLAYFPELKKARYRTAGAQRCEGKDTLMFTGIERGYTAEIYISFISDNRKNISNSIHLGQLTW